MPLEPFQDLLHEGHTVMPTPRAPLCPRFHDLAQKSFSQHRDRYDRIEVLTYLAFTWSEYSLIGGLSYTSERKGVAVLRLPFRFFFVPQTKWVRKWNICGVDFWHLPNAYRPSSWYKYHQALPPMCSSSEYSSTQTHLYRALGSKVRYLSSICSWKEALQFMTIGLLSGYTIHPQELIVKPLIVVLRSGPTEFDSKLLGWKKIMQSLGQITSARCDTPLQRSALRGFFHDCLMHFY